MAIQSLSIVMLSSPPATIKSWRAASGKTTPMPPTTSPSETKPGRVEHVEVKRSTEPQSNQGCDQAPRQEKCHHKRVPGAEDFNEAPGPVAVDATYVVQLRWKKGRGPRLEGQRNEEDRDNLRDERVEVRRSDLRHGIRVSQTERRCEHIGSVGMW